MTETEFNALAAQGYNRIPVTLETFADLDTPLSIYLKLANGRITYLLESVQGGERFGRYSIIGLAAQTRIVVNGHQVLVLTGHRISEREDDTNPLDFIDEVHEALQGAARVRPAAFLRRPGRLLRLRHRALCRDQADAAHTDKPDDRHAGHRLRRRHHAGRAVAAAVPSVPGIAARAVPRAAGAESVALHVLLRPRRLPRRRGESRDPRAPRR
jgi:hypothetical protein